MNELPGRCLYSLNYLGSRIADWEGRGRGRVVGGRVPGAIRAKERHFYTKKNLAGEYQILSLGRQYSISGGTMNISGGAEGRLGWVEGVQEPHSP